MDGSVTGASVFQHVSGGMHMPIVLLIADPQAHFPDRSQLHRFELGVCGDHKPCVLYLYPTQILSDGNASVAQATPNANSAVVPHRNSPLKIRFD